MEEGGEFAGRLREFRLMNILLFSSSPPTVKRVRVVNGRNEPIVKAYKIYIKTCRQAAIVFD